jgi:hypothetical protein
MICFATNIEATDRLYLNMLQGRVQCWMVRIELQYIIIYIKTERN